MPKSKADKKVPFAKGFHRPTEREQKLALGEFEESVPYHLEASPDLFFPIPDPSDEIDWLAQFKEEGQTFGQFLDENPWFGSRKLRGMTCDFKKDGETLPDRYPGSCVYLQRMGELVGGPDWSLLTEYVSLYFGLPIRKLPPLEIVQQETRGRETLHLKQAAATTTTDPLPPTTSTKRPTRGTSKKAIQSKTSPPIQFREHTNENGEYRRQLGVGPILSFLSEIVPSDALCLVTLTMEDLYDEEPDLFVAGMAKGNKRVAVFSFHRYDPLLSFSEEHWFDQTKETLTLPTAGTSSTDDEPPKKKRKTGGGPSRSEPPTISTVFKDTLLLERCCKLVVHEAMHLLGIEHCIFYQCCMNGSGHLKEDFRQPMMLCPVDLRKLELLCGFDPLERYRNLMAFFVKTGMKEHAEWIQKALKFIEEKSA